MVQGVFITSSIISSNYFNAASLLGLGLVYSYLGYVLVFIIAIWLMIRVATRRLYQAKGRQEKIIQEKELEIDLQKNEIEQLKADLIEKNFILEQQQLEVLAQRDAILEKNQVFEQQNEEIHAQNDELEKQRDLVEAHNQKMLDSITYAKKIQEALLTPSEVLNDIIPEHFILYKPKDIVSGDFYWIKKIKNIIVVATADSTGHGIPGALLSMLGTSLLSEAYSKSWVYSPGAILDILRRKIKQSLRQNNDVASQRDGMDISLYTIDEETLELQYAGAFNSIYIVRKKESLAHAEKFKIIENENNMLIELKADNQPIGIHYDEREFKTIRFQLKSGDVIYSFSDGYYDQFGGDDKSKFKSVYFKKLLLELHPNHPQKLKEILEETHQNWKKNNVQTDDILVIGIRITKENFG